MPSFRCGVFQLVLGISRSVNQFLGVLPTETLKQVVVSGFYVIFYDLDYPGKRV